ncbi:MAG TPA: hypothetical protein VEJ43_11920 [Pseudolabrys sp.]|nr:hypothetical protein [Pseudolabrys sp.]
MDLHTKRGFKPKKTDREPVIVKIFVVFLVGTVLVCAGMLAVPLSNAVIDVWQSRVTVQQTGVSKDLAQRNRVEDAAVKIWSLGKRDQ